MDDLGDYGGDRSSYRTGTRCARAGHGEGIVVDMKGLNDILDFHKYVVTGSLFSRLVYHAL